MSKRDNDYATLVTNLSGLGLSGLAMNERRLARYARKQPMLWAKAAPLLCDMSARLVKQTPSNHVFLCNRAGEYESLYAQSEARFAVEPLPPALSAEELYARVEAGELALRAEPGQRAAGPVLPCAHLLWMDAKTKQAYRCGTGAQTRQLEQALAPFVNLTRRSRTSPADFGVADAVRALSEARPRLERLFGRLAEARKDKKEKKEKKDKKGKKTKKTKKAKKPKVVSDEEEEEDDEENWEREAREAFALIQARHREQSEAIAQTKSARAERKAKKLAKKEKREKREKREKKRMRAEKETAQPVKKRKTAAESALPEIIVTDPAGVVSSLSEAQCLEAALWLEPTTVV